MTKKAISVLLLLILVLPSAKISDAADISLSSQSACLISLDTGKILFEKNATERLPMASTTKIMTCLVAIEKGKLDSSVTIDERAVGIEGSSMYFEAGDSLTLEELLYAMMLRSANDAATAIAYHIAGSLEEFANLMNERAAELGLSDTHFENPHGLPAENHFASAKDFAHLTVTALANPTFKKIVSSKAHTVKFSNGKEIYVVNHNKLLKDYNGAIGVKTGYTRSSGRCLVSAAERNGVTFVAVTFNAPNDWSDHKKLLDFGFSEMQKTTALQKGQLRHAVNVAGNGCVDIVNRDEVTLIVGKDAKITYKISARHIEFAPIDTDVAIGYAEIYVDSVLAAKIPLYPTSDVEEEKTPSKIQSFFNLFK